MILFQNIAIMNEDLGDDIDISLSPVRKSAPKQVELNISITYIFKFPIIFFYFPKFLMLETSITHFILLFFLVSKPEILKLIFLVFFFFFPKLQKLNISAIYKTVILIFSVNLPMVFNYKFYKIVIQPPGEPREHHIGQVKFDQKSSSYTK